MEKRKSTAMFRRTRRGGCPHPRGGRKAASRSGRCGHRPLRSGSQNLCRSALWEGLRGIASAPRAHIQCAPTATPEAHPLPLGERHMIYLDNSATTRPCVAAVAAMTEMLTTIWGNPSSLHGLGLEAGRRLKAARKAVANALGA